MTSQTHRIDVVINNRDGRRSTDEIAAGLRNAGNEADKASARVGLLGGAINRAKTQLLSMNSALAGFSAGFAALAAVNVISGFDDQMASVRAVTLATDAEFAKLRATALDLGATTRYSATQAAEGLELLGRAGADANQSVGLIGTTLKLAQAEGLSLAQSSDFLVKTLAQMRLGFDQAGRVADVLSATASKTTTDVKELATAFTYAGAIAAGFKTPVEEVAAALGVLAQSGQSASLGGTSVRGFLARIASPTKEFEADLKSLNLTIKDINPETNSLIQIIEKLRDAGLKTGKAFELFKQRSGSGVEILVNNIPMLKRLNTELQNVGGTLDLKNAIKADTLAADMKSALAAVNSLIIAIGDAGLTAVLRAAFTGFAALTRGLAEGLTTIAPYIYNVGQALLIAFSPYILAGFIAGLIQIAPLLLGVAAAATRAAAAVALFAAANPFTALIAGAAILYTAFGDTISQMRVAGTQAATVGDVFAVVWDRITSGVAYVGRAAGTAFDAVLSFGTSAANGIMSAFQTAINFIIGLLQQLASAAAAVVNSIAGFFGGGGIGELKIPTIELPKLETPSIVKGILGEADDRALQRHEEQVGVALREADAVKRLNDAKADAAAKARNLAGAEDEEAGAAGRSKTARQELLSAINGPAHEALTQMAALNQLFREGAISTSEYADQLQRLRGQLLQNDQTLQGGILKGLNKVAEGATKLGDNVEGFVTGAFNKATDAIVNFAKTGKLDFKALISSILEDLLRLSLNAVWGQLANGMLGAFGGGGVGGAGMLGGGGGGIGSLLGFATGGGFTVGGSGGTDSQPVGFMATPGERVTVETPQQQKAGYRGGGGGAPIVNIMAPPGTEVQRQERRKDSGGRDVLDIVLGRVGEAVSAGRYDKDFGGRYGMSTQTLRR